MKKRNSILKSMMMTIFTINCFGNSLKNVQAKVDQIRLRWEGIDIQNKLFSQSCVDNNLRFFLIKGSGLRFKNCAQKPKERLMRRPVKDVACATKYTQSWYLLWRHTRKLRGMIQQKMNCLLLCLDHRLLLIDLTTSYAFVCD